MASDRRTFLQLLSASALTASFPVSIARALSIPANNRTGSINDVEHIVFMMQENQLLRGSPSADSARAVNSIVAINYVLHPGAPNLGLQFLQDLAHDWITTHAAWNEGNNDQWIPQKGTTAMAHLTRSDIPYHYALADAFTVCDAYHCSLLPTPTPLSHCGHGWVGNTSRGPVIDNAEVGYDWSTYPELLARKGRRILEDLSGHW